MSISLNEQSKAELNEQLSLLARAIKVFGPRNYTALAKVTGLSVQDVRYKIKRQLLSKGLRVQIHVDHGKLGLARYKLRLRFANSVEDANVKLLEHFANSCYLEYYGRLLPRGDYLVWLGLPPSLEKRYRVFLDRVVEMGVFKRYELSRVSWIRYFSMREDCYDFRRGVWRFSWDSLPSRVVDDVSVEEDVISKPKLDKLDLYITAWLQVDALMPIPEIAERLGIQYKKVLYHFKEHVLKRGILKRYVLRWQGLEGDYSLAYLLVCVKDLTEGELEDVKTVFLRNPFTCFDTYEADRGLYTAYITVPVSQLQQCLSYIWRSLPNIRGKISHGFIDPKCSRAFAIPVELYQKDGGWMFNVEEALKAVNRLLKRA
jgi:DNA-binding Lrp family transcriptional regulator